MASEYSNGIISTAFSLHKCKSKRKEKMNLEGFVVLQYIVVHKINISSNKLINNRIIISATSFYLEARLYVMHE